MFDKKKENLFPGSPINKFIKAATSNDETTSGNGSLKYTTSGNTFVDQFAAISRYREPRSYQQVSVDQEQLWCLDPLTTIKFSLYLRGITRKPQYLETVFKGQGLKNEGIYRLMWIAINHPADFYENFMLMVEAGSWQDVFKMLQLDLVYHGWKGRKLNWPIFMKFIRAGLSNNKMTHLVRKYLPTIHTNSKCTTVEKQADTIIGRWIAVNLFPELDHKRSFKQYRLLKSCGIAHEWQQKISKQLYKEINFDTVAGRALAQLVGSKFLENHNLVNDYEKWISSKPIVKFTGFVAELFKDVDSAKEYQLKTIDAQFKQLIETAGNSNSKLLVARDVSGSMLSKAIGTNMSSYDVAKAIALYFSEMLDGPFKGHYLTFETSIHFNQWQGKTPTQKFKNAKEFKFGSTDFLRIADFLIKQLNKGVPESEFPNGILAISDGEFDRGSQNLTTFQEFRHKLKANGFSEEFVDNFKLILWDIPNSYYGRTKPVFENYSSCPNSFHISGYDPAAISFIMGNGYTKQVPKNNDELFQIAMDQELLNHVVLHKDK